MHIRPLFKNLARRFSPYFMICSAVLSAGTHAALPQMEAPKAQAKTVDRARTRSRAELVGSATLMASPVFRVSGAPTLNSTWAPRA